MVEFDVIQEFIGDDLNVMTNRGRGSITYGQTSDGFPVVKRHQLIADIYTPGQGPVEERYDFSLHRIACTDADFTLSAFGLNEPPGITWERPTPWWLWLIGSAFALLLVAAGFTWLKRRAMRSRAAAA
jgi:hypothetical protein